VIRFVCWTGVSRSGSSFRVCGADVLVLLVSLRCCHGEQERREGIAARGCCQGRIRIRALRMANSGAGWSRRISFAGTKRTDRFPKPGITSVRPDKSRRRLGGSPYRWPREYGEPERMEWRWRTDARRIRFSRAGRFARVAKAGKRNNIRAARYCGLDSFVSISDPAPSRCRGVLSRSPFHEPIPKPAILTVQPR
jgi:hypothetical protein